ncbi:hypothetical protein LY13_004455 [Prauserella aidingensis]|uniref:DUF4097 family beta strand repeat-containing protein n=1 Tax=Prauserella aidingensis TaxID=387890 RepID=UPI0020A3BC3A|nr:DUF4097 family beta strand repeat-containing protein [Prauserella aidingensis]MCP2255674.1 hypothetical protein [Prauserella aidingensis]
MSRRSVLAVGGAVFVVAGVGVGTGWLWPTSEERTGIVDADVERIRLDLGSGDVDIRVDENAQRTTVRQSVQRLFAEPGETYEVDGSTLELGDCDWFCSVNYEVTVPSRVAVDGEFNSATLTVDGVGDVHVEMNSGDVRGSARGSVDVDGNSGSVELEVADPRRVTADLNSGDVRLTVPDGEYEVLGDSNSGDRDIGVTVSPNADRVLDLSTNSGDVLVEPR